MSTPEHVGSYDSRGPMVDGWKCSCGWKSADYFDGAHYAEAQWKKHAMTPDPDSRLRADVAPAVLREVIAKAINPEAFKDGPWLGADEYFRDAMRRANAVLAALGIPSDVLAALRSGEMVAVPREPTEEMWGGLARDIVMWTRFPDITGESLHHHLRHLGRSIPNWLAKLIPDEKRVPPKGAVADAIYRAALAAAPSVARKEDGRG